MLINIETVMAVLHISMLVIIGAAVCLANELPEKVYYNLDEAATIFKDYIKQFDKVYDSQEYRVRLQIFRDNLRQINEDNARTNLTVFGINQFTDLTDEEFKIIYMSGFIMPASSGNAVEYNSVGNAPAELDYRQYGYVTAVKNQGTCGACYVFSAIGNIEGQYAKQHGQLISLSEQQGLDCDNLSSGCRGGLVDQVMQALASQGGSMTEEDYAYVGQKGSCSTDSSKIVVKVTSGSALTVSGEEGLKDLLANTGPLSIAVTACPAFKSYTAGIYTENCPGTINHAVLLVGYGTANGEDYWIIKNSWDTVWGEQGYMKMQRGVGLCSIGQYVASATVA